MFVSLMLFHWIFRSENHILSMNSFHVCVFSDGVNNAFCLTPLLMASKMQWVLGSLVFTVLCAA